MSGLEMLWFVFLALGVVYLLKKLSDTGGEDPSLVELEEEMRTMQIEENIEHGIITEVIPERRKKSRGFQSGKSEKGISLRVRIPNNQGTTTDFWLPIPDELDGRSKIEFFKYLYDIPLDDLDELVGLKVPVEKNRNDEWEVTWEKEWREEFGVLAAIQTSLFGTDPRNEEEPVDISVLDKE